MAAYKIFDFTNSAWYTLLKCTKRGVSMITGKDAVSLQVMESFQKQMKLNDIAVQFNLSIDQVKRLKRYFNYNEWIKEEIGEQSAEQFAALGLKSLVLSRFVNKEGIEVLLDILPLTSAGTKRDELLTYVRLYEEKQNRVQEFQQIHEKYLAETEKQVVELNKQMKGLTSKRNKIMKQYKFTKKYSKELSDLLLYYLAVLPTCYALRHRLHDGFKTRLRKLNVIEMNEEYVWEVKDLDLFVAEMERRLEKGYKYEYTGDESERYSAVYRHTEQEEFIEQEFKETKRKIREIKNKQQANEQAWKQAKKQPFLTYQESSIGSNQLSEKELLAHRNMQNDAMKWLYSQGYVVCTEVTLPNGRRADVIGYRGDKIVIIEVKSSSGDYKRDKKWREYLPYCHDFYFYLGYVHFLGVDDANTCEGNVLFAPKRTKEIGVYKISEDAAVGEIVDDAIDDLKYTIARTLSKKDFLGW